MIKNSDIAKVMRDIGFLTEVIEEDPNVQFRARAYYRAADTITGLRENVADIYSKHGINGLLEIQSIGKAIACKIEEYIKRGKVRNLEELRAKVPIAIDELYGIEGIGPKTIRMFYDKLHIKNLAELEEAAAKGKLRTVPGFTEKKEQDIIKKIESGLSEFGFSAAAVEFVPGHPVPPSRFVTAQQFLGANTHKRPQFPASCRSSATEAATCFEGYAQVHGGRSAHTYP